MRKFSLRYQKSIVLIAFFGLLSLTWQVPPRGGVMYLDYHGNDGRLATASYLVTRDGFFRMFGGTYQAATEQERIAILNDDDMNGDGNEGDAKLLVVLERMSCEPETRADAHLWLEDGRARGRQTFCSNLVSGRTTISEGETELAVGVSEGWGGGSGVEATGKANLATLRVTAYYEPKAHVCICASCADFCCKPCGGVLPKVGKGYCMSKEAMPEWRSGLVCPCGLHDASNTPCDARRPPMSGPSAPRGDRAGAGPRETSYLMYWVVGLSVLGVALILGVWHQAKKGTTRSRKHTDDGYRHQNSHSNAYGLNMEPHGGMSLRTRGQDKYES